MTTFRLLRARRSSVFAARAGVFLLAGLGAGCDPSSTTDVGVPTEALRLDSPVAPPYGTWQVGVRGTTFSTASVEGSLGALPLTAAVLDDSTAVVLVPAVQPGVHELTLDVGSRRFAGTVQVSPAPAVADPMEYVDSLVADLAAGLDVREAQLVEEEAGPAAGDLAAYRADLEEIRALLAEAEAEFRAASPADQQAIAAYLAANTADPGVQASRFPGGPSFSTSPLYGMACGSAPDYWECAFRAIEIIRNVAGAYVAGAAVTNVVSWFFTPAGKTAAKLATAVGAGAFLGGSYIVIDKYLVEENFATVQAPEGVLEFDAGRGSAVAVVAEYHSLTTADLASHPGAARAADALNSLATVWRQLSDLIPFFDSSAPTVPTQPRTKNLRYVPPGQLSLGITNPTSVVGSSVVADGEWQLTFDQLGQVMSRVPFTFEIRLDPPGLPGSTALAHAALNLVPDSVPIYEQALVGTTWTVAITGQEVPYRLELLAEGRGYYYSEEGPGTQAGTWDMSWGVIERDGRYHFVDSGFWNGWSPTSALTYPLGTMKASSECCPDDVVTYTR